MRSVLFRLLFGSLMITFGCVGCTSTRVVSVRTSTARVASGGVLYALPKTEICVDVTVVHRDTSQAPYAAFAEEMLAGVSPVDAYRIAHIDVSTRLVADESNYYYVLPKGTALQIDRRHLLRAVGMDDLVDDESRITDDFSDDGLSDTSAKPLPAYNLYDRVDTFYRRGDLPGHPSLTLTKKDRRSLRRQALDVAEQIGTLQEVRRQLIEGDPEDARSPEALHYQLQQVERQLERLSALFMGRDVSATVRFVVAPAEGRSEMTETTQALFFFSPQHGIVDSLVDGAEAVRCVFRRDGGLRSAARFVRYHTGDASRLDKRNSIKYRAAESVEFSIESAFFQLRRTLPVCQYGPVLELPRGRVKARFDADTGELIYLSR